MIRTSFFLILFFFISLTAKSQKKLSLAAGLNYSSVSSINSTNPDGKIGLNIIVAYKFYMNDLGWFLKPGLSYSQEGWSLQRLDYLNVPLVVGFDFTNDFNLNLGLQYGYMIGGFNEPQDAVDRNNMAFLFGFEFYPTNHIDVGLRFASGTKNILKEPINGIEDARTYSIQFYLAYNLFIKDR